jgi:hypothetical protein
MSTQPAVCISSRQRNASATRSSWSEPTASAHASGTARRGPKVRELGKIADRVCRLSTRNVMPARQVRDAYVRGLISDSRKQFDVLMQEDPAWLQRVAEAAGA